MYLLRAFATGQPAAPLLTAVPARCLATPGFQELLQVRTDCVCTAFVALRQAYQQACQSTSQASLRSSLPFTQLNLQHITLWIMQRPG